MASIASNLQDRNDDSEFAALLEENFGKDQTIEKSVVNGTVVDIDDEFAIIDVGLKSEGRVSLREFSMPGQAPDGAIGNGVEVFVERVEGRDGLTVLSR